MTPAGLARVLTAGRWQLADHLALLNRRLVDLAVGDIRRLAVFMPPRHGKSEFISRYLPAWWLGHNPEQRIIEAGYGNRFAATWGRRVRDAVNEACHFGIFPTLVRKDLSAADNWEIEGHAGGMLTAGVGGAVTGFGAHLLIIDDPVKSREEAESITFRERIWDWYHADIYTRLEPEARVVLVQTRWHEDDLAGRVIQGMNDEDQYQWTTITLPAIAEEDDLLGRAPGDALWPNRYPNHVLEDIRRQLGSYDFSALYQQHPTPREGGLFKREWFRIAEMAPGNAKRRVRYWDLAGSEDGDYTAGVRMAQSYDGMYYVEDIVRVQTTPNMVRQTVESTARMDGADVLQVIEEDPGQAGKDQILSYKQLLAGFPFDSVRPSGDKVVRALPYAAQVEAGNVYFVNGPWLNAYIDELCVFPNGRNDDQIDGSSGAFTKLFSGAIGAYAANSTNRRRRPL